jgi:putative ABC transport system permease protein
MSRLTHSISTWSRELIVGVRTLARQPAFSLAAIATFALGIGAATAIFSVVYGVTFRPLPYPDPDRLIRIYEASHAAGDAKHPVSEATFHEWRTNLSTVASVALITDARTRFLDGDSPRPLSVAGVSPSFFEVLAVAPLYGRVFQDESAYRNIRDSTNELVLSYEAWQRLFGGDPAVIGQRVRFATRAESSVVVGIMPYGFAFERAVDAWAPSVMRLPIGRIVRSWRYDRVVARLHPNRSLDDVRAELEVVSARLARDFPVSNAGWSATVETLQDAIVGRFGRASWLFLAAVGGVLLVACANVAGLLTARALDRRRETSIRLALGAGRGRVMQMWLSEALVLASLGAGCGVAMAWALIQLLRAAAPPGIPRLEDIAVDGWSLAFALAAMVMAAVVCAVGPAYSTRDRALGRDVLSGGRTGTDRPQRRRLSAGLVTLQTGAAVALVLVSIVFARSFAQLIQVDLGWRPDRVLSLHVAPRPPAADRRPWFWYVQWADRLTARLEATPGIARAAVTTVIPFSPEIIPADVASGREVRGDETRWPIELHAVTDGYFDTMGLTLRRGRLFGATDRFDEPTLNYRTKASHGVAIVTESVARSLWPGQDPIGQSIRVPTIDNAPFREVIGVVGDVQFASVGGRPPLTVFLPWAQMPSGVPRLVVRATTDAAAIANSVSAAVHAEQLATGIDRVLVLASLVDRALAPARLTTQLIAALGVLAILLASVGVYGSLSTLVRARAREIAVRIAVGASPVQTLRRVLLWGLSPVMAGTVMGVAVAPLVISSAQSLLYGIDRVGFVSVVASGTVILVMTTVACLAPAIRAVRTDPIRVLRAD